MRNSLGHFHSADAYDIATFTTFFQRRNPLIPPTDEQLQAELVQGGVPRSVLDDFADTAKSFPNFTPTGIQLASTFGGYHDFNFEH